MCGAPAGGSSRCGESRRPARLHGPCLAARSDKADGERVYWIIARVPTCGPPMKPSRCCPVYRHDQGRNCPPSHPRAVASIVLRFDIAVAFELLTASCQYDNILS